MSREEERKAAMKVEYRGAGCAARTSHREISNFTLLGKNSHNWQISRALYHFFLSCQWSLSSYHSLFSVATILGEGENDKRIIWIWREQYLARQQASSAPANWKTATTAREAARAGTVPASRTEKQPDSICNEQWDLRMSSELQPGIDQPEVEQLSGWDRDQDRWNWQKSSRRGAPATKCLHWYDNVNCQGLRAALMWYISRGMLQKCKLAIELWKWFKLCGPRMTRPVEQTLEVSHFQG